MELRLSSARALVLALICSLSLCFSFLSPPTAAQSLFSLSAGPLELTLIPHDLSGKDCSMSVCPADTVTNFYFNDIIPNDDPCYLATILKGASASGAASSEENTIEVGIAGLLDAVLNGGVQCATNLESVFSDFACSLSSGFDVESVQVRMIENLTPEEITNIGSLASCTCPDFPRLIVNMVLPSFCSSPCIDPTATCILGYSANEMDYILYRYQLRSLREQIAAHSCGLTTAASVLAPLVRVNTSDSYAPYLTDQVDYLTTCIPEVSENVPDELNYDVSSTKRKRRYYWR